MAKPASPDRSALEKILDWAKAEPEVTVGEDGTITVGGDRPIRLTVTADEERVQLVHHHTETSEDPARFEAVRRGLPARGSAVTGTVSAAADELEVTLTSTLYTDGLTRQGFISAFHEMIATADRAIGPVASTEPVAKPAPASESPPEADTAESTPAAAPSADTPPADSAPTMVLSSVWVPTHRVPDGGLRAWPKPDPAVEPIATLQPRVELSIAEQRGDWARVVGSNGWTGWVDLRRLQTMPGGRVRPSAPTTPGAAKAGGASFPLGAIGGAILAAAAFLPWFSIPGFDEANAFDISLSFLWDLNGTGDPMLGLAIVALGGLGLLAAILPLVPARLRRLAALAGLVLTGLFVFQVHRGIDTTFSDTTDAMGIGVYAALAGALLLLVAPKRS